MIVALLCLDLGRRLFMRANTRELMSEIKRAESYMNPARIVIRYRSLSESAGSSAGSVGHSMREMLLAVAAADARCSGEMSDDVLSHIAT